MSAAPSRPRILFLINSLCGGGAERIMSMLLENSEAWSTRFDIVLALLDREAAAYSIPKFVTVHQLDCRFSLIRSYLQVRRLVAELNPAVTLSFLTRANVSNCLVSPSDGRPAIISERINTDMQLGSGLRGVLTKKIVRFAYPKADRVVAVARGVGSTLIRNYGVQRSRIDVIPNPVDVQAINARAAVGSTNVPDGPFVFAMGRLVPNKNFPLLLRAFASSGISGKLLIAGEGTERSRLLELAKELGIADRLLLPGFIANPHALLARAQSFVLSSNAEGFPNSLVEALSLGIPSIATNCADGPAEILAGVERKEIRGTHLTDGGILVPVDDANALAAALRTVQDPATCKRLSVGGRRLARSFSVAGSVERYWQVIEQELERAPAQVPKLAPA
jgi:glycosyltransferase involved in cell wall biosynthesis